METRAKPSLLEVVVLLTQRLAVQKKNHPFHPTTFFWFRFVLQSFVNTSAGSATFALIQQRPTSLFARCRNLSLGGTLESDQPDESLGSADGLAGGRP